MRISQYSGSKAENNESTSFIAISALCTTIQFADYKKKKNQNFPSWIFQNKMKSKRKRKNLASLISSLWRRAFQSRFESLNGSAPEKKKQKNSPRKFNSKIKDTEIEILIITYCLSRLSILRVLCSILVIIASASAFSASTISPLPAILLSLSL